MSRRNNLVLANVCLAALYGCGGGSDEQSTVVKQSDPAPQVQLTGVKNNSALTMAPRKTDHVLYRASLAGNDSRTGETGFVLNYIPTVINGPQWHIWVDDDLTSTVWSIKKSPAKDTSLPESAIHRVSVTIGSPTLLADKSESVADDNKVKILDDISHSVKTLDLSSAGTSMYPNWSGKMALTQINTRHVDTASWHKNNGLGTDMLGNVETTRNGDKISISMELPAAGCTLLGEGKPSNSIRKFERFTITGFDKCGFDPARGSNWTPRDYLNTGGLAKANKDGEVAYATTFKNESGAEMLMVGFPSLDGVMFMMQKS
ncbi:hypothetical protein [Aeromonas jandaei]|uniref:hypothetical protein n=1 Tax=Aeromonas jandaei TaxID=650 RepID=UPI003EC9254D